jgi:thymidylate synthase (FAD)
MKDLLEGLDSFHQVLGEAGQLRLVDVMPRLVPDGQTADMAIVQAARVSYGEGTKKVSEDAGLIRYLLRHNHGTPFEMVRFKFHIRMPVYVYRQFFRHRTVDNCEIEIISTDENMRKYLSMNEYSARYSVVPDIYHVPDLRIQSETNKQGGEEPASAALNEAWRSLAKDTAEGAYEGYKEMLALGASRELARTNLPISFVTEFYASVDLRNLMEFLTLRCDSHAQQEVRVFANEMAKIFKQVAPIAYGAWLDYKYGASTFSRAEIDFLRYLLGNLENTNMPFGKRERAEFIAKLTRKPDPGE